MEIKLRNPDEIIRDLSFDEKLRVIKDINELRETGFVKENLYNLSRLISDELGMKDKNMWVDLIQKTLPLFVANELIEFNKIVPKDLF